MNSSHVNNSYRSLIHGLLSPGRPAQDRGRGALGGEGARPVLKGLTILGGSPVKPAVAISALCRPTREGKGFTPRQRPGWACRCGGVLGR